MEEQRQLTVADVIDITIHQLEFINVPVGLTDQIGVPISRAVGNLKAVQEALQKGNEDGRETDPE